MAITLNTITIDAPVTQGYVGPQGPKGDAGEVQGDGSGVSDAEAFRTAISAPAAAQLSDRMVVLADSSGLNDAAADINAVISSAAGRKVVIPPGTYLLESAAVINADGVQIDAAGATFVAADGMDDACLAIYGASGVRVRGLKIDGNGANQNFVSGETLPCGIVATNVRDLVIEYCDLDDFAEHGIQVTSYGNYASESVLFGNEGPVRDITVRRNRVSGFRYGGILLQGGAASGTGEASGGWVKDNWISNIDATGLAGGGSDVMNVGDGFRNCEISGNHMYGKGEGVLAIEAHDRPGVRATEDIRIFGNHISGQGGTPPIVTEHDHDPMRDVIIARNTIIQTGVAGSAPGYSCIDLSANGTTLTRWTIERNTMRAGSSGNAVAVNMNRTAATGFASLTIRDNDVTEAGWLYLQTDGPATDLTISGKNKSAGQRCVVANGLGNVSISGLEFVGSGGGDGIKLIDCGDVEVDGCTLRNARDGVFVQDCDLARVSGNIIREHTRDGIRISETDDTDMHGVVVAANVIRTSEASNNGIIFDEDNSGRIDHYILKDNTVSVGGGNDINTGSVTGAGGVEADNVVY